MKCEVRNVESKEVYEISPEGVVFGRAGGPAGITVLDQSVSKRHARIFNDNGVWFLEDMKSVNGTVVNSRRLSEPLALAPGVVFSLAKHRFEVLSVGGAAAPPAMRSRGIGPGSEPDPRRPGPSSAPNGASGPPSSAQAAHRGGSAGASSAASPGASSRSRSSGAAAEDHLASLSELEPMLPQESSGSRRSSRQADAHSYDGPEPVSNQGAARAGAVAVLTALPRAVAHYLAAVPMLMFAGRAAVRRGIEAPLRPMGPLELVAFFLPVQLLAGMLVPMAGGVGALVAGGDLASSSLLPIDVLVVALGAAVVSGMVGHPVTSFVVERLLKGRSDAGTRTNFLVMMQGAYAVVLVPAAVTALLSPIAAKLATTTPAASLLLLLPALLTALLDPVPAYVLWRWLEHFGVLAMARTVAMVLFILSIVAALILAAQASLGAVGAAPAALGVRNDKVDSSDGETPEPTKPVADNPAVPTKSDEKNASPEGGARAIDGGTKSEPGGAKSEPGAANDSASATSAVGAVVSLQRSAPAPKPSAYTAYREQLSFVEATIANNPALLIDDAKAAKLYKELSREKVSAIADADAAIPRGERAALKFFVEKYREAYVYKRTQKTVDELHRHLSR